MGRWREAWRTAPEGSAENAKLRVARLRGPRARGGSRPRSCGCSGVGEATIGDWKRAGYLHPRLPGVYAVGSPARTDESDLWEAVLYAGPGAMLSPRDGRLVARPDRLSRSAPIHVSTPRRKRSLPGIAVHGRRTGPGPPAPQGDAGHVDRPDDVRPRRPGRAQARPQGAGQPRLREQPARDRRSAAMCGQGRPGSAALQWAIDNYEPLFAQTQSPLEDDYIELCESLDIPKPDRDQRPRARDPERRRLLRRDADRRARRDRQPPLAGTGLPRPPQRQEAARRRGGWSCATRASSSRRTPRACGTRSSGNSPSGLGEPGERGRFSLAGMAADKLKRYRDKRDFTQTSEPGGRVRSALTAAAGGRSPGSSSRSITRRDCTGTCGSSTTGCWRPGRSRTGSRRRRRRTGWRSAPRTTRCSTWTSTARSRRASTAPARWRSGTRARTRPISSTPRRSRSRSTASGSAAATGCSRSAATRRVGATRRTTG